MATDTISTNLFSYSSRYDIQSRCMTPIAYNKTQTYNKTQDIKQYIRHTTKHKLTPRTWHYDISRVMNWIRINSNIDALKEFIVLFVCVKRQMLVNTYLVMTICVYGHMFRSDHTRKVLVIDLINVENVPFIKSLIK